MSTRSSIYSNEDVTIHLFEDCLCEYEENGLHFDFNTKAIAPGDGNYGDFSISATGKNGVDVSVRIPYEVCEAIAAFAERRRAISDGGGKS